MIYRKKLKKVFHFQWIGMVSMLFILGLMLAYDLYTTRRSAEINEGDRLMMQARIVEDNLSLQFATTYDSLQSVIRDLPQYRAGNYQIDLKKRLDTISNAIPGIQAIFITDENGIVEFSNREELIGKDCNKSDFFSTAQLKNESGRMYLSAPFMSTPNVYVINLSSVIQDSAGNFKGIISASLNPYYFKTLINSVLYAPDMWAYVANPDRHLYLALPQRAEFDRLAGKDLNHDDSFSRHISGNKDETLSISRSNLTGNDEMTALVDIGLAEAQLDKPVIFSLHRNLKDIFAEWRGRLALYLAGYSLVIFFAITSLGYFQKRIGKAELNIQSAQESMEGADDKYRAIFNNMRDVIYRTDANGILLDMSPSGSRHLGYTMEEIIGSPVANYHANPSDHAAMLKKLALDGEITDYELVMKRKDKKLIQVSVNAHCVRNRSGKIIGIEGSWRDITKKKATEQQLAALVLVDGLTQISNRRRFDLEIQREYKRARRDKTPLSLLMLDIDCFKLYNDNYGHAAGDECLSMVAQTLFKNMPRSGDLVARYGGEEFVVMLPSTPLSGAKHVAEKLRTKVEAMRLPHKYSSVSKYVTISVGCATFEFNGDEPPDYASLIENADGMLYKAKSGGKNRICG